MNLVIFSPQSCWPSSASPSGFVTGSGSHIRFRTLSELFDATRVVMPGYPAQNKTVENPITGHNISVIPLSKPFGSGFWRMVGFPLWLVRNCPLMIREILRADAVHTAIPGETGTLGMILALAFRKPLLVRNGRNWFDQKTAGERLLKWLMERFGSERNVMLATGGGSKPPSPTNPHVYWMFSTTLTEDQLHACGMRTRQLSREQPRLIIVSRQIKEKGTGVLIKSLPLILKDFPGATLEVVGDGSELAGFKELTVTLGIGDRITFTGGVNHARVIERLKQADLFCLPTSHQEGFPRAILEALACGLPVITTRVSVLPQLIGTGCGILINETTPAEIAQAVRECLSDEERYRNMSARAIETASPYSLERWRDTIGDLLRSKWGPLRSYS